MRKYKIIEKTDRTKIQFIKVLTQNGIFKEYLIDGKQTDRTNRWHQTFNVRALISKEDGSIGYVVLRHYLKPDFCFPIKPSEVFICRSDQELLDKIEELRQEHLDKLAAALLLEKLKTDLQN